MTRKYLRDSVTGRPYDPVTKEWLDEQARDAVRGDYSVRAIERAPTRQVLTHKHVEPPALEVTPAQATQEKESEPDQVVQPSLLEELDELKNNKLFDA